MAWDFSCGDSSRAVAVRDWPFQRDGCCRGRRHKLALGASPPLAAAWQASARRRRRWRRQRQVGLDLHGDGADARRGRLHGQLRREAHREGGGGQHNGAIDSRGAEAKGAAPQRGKADGAIYRGDAEVRGGRRGTEGTRKKHRRHLLISRSIAPQNDGCGGQGGAKPAARSGCRPRPGVPHAHGPLGAAIRPRLGAVFEACVRCPIHVKLAAQRGPSFTSPSELPLRRQGYSIRISKPAALVEDS